MQETLINVEEVLYLCFLMLNSLMFIPQAVKMYTGKSSENVSLITFLGFLLIQVSTIIHGFVVKDFLLAYGTMPSLVTNSLVVLFILVYRKKKNYEHR